MSKCKIIIVYLYYQIAHKIILKSKIMKPMSALLFSIALICTIAVAKVKGQVVAIGHVCAEVVESVSASSKAVTGFHLKNGSTAAESTISGQDNLNMSSLSMGTITINSGANIACNLVLKSATLSDTNGNNFTIDTAMTTFGRSDTGRADGNQTIQVNGTAHMTHGQASGLYQGSYTMVFAYN